MSQEEQVKHEWCKEVRILQGMINKDIASFTHLKIKGQKLVGDKQSGVTKELLQSVEGGLKSLQEQGESIYEVLMEGSSIDPLVFNRDQFIKQVEKAKKIVNSLADIKSRGQRIIGK